MANNDDIDNDIEDIDFDAEAGFEDTAKSGTLGDMWRNNPMVKIGAVLAVFAVIVGAIILFGGSKEKQNPSKLQTAPEIVNKKDDQNIVTPNYAEQIQKRNEEAVESAIKNQTSALPITTEPARGKIAPEIEESTEEDPLERWRKLQEQRLRAQPQPKQAVQNDNNKNNQVDTRAQAVNEMAQAMSAQMEAILEARKTPEMQIVQITPIEYIENLQEKKEKKLEEARKASEKGAEDEVEVILLPAGELEYAQLITEANSDAPGPVLAEIMSGPLKGSKILGTFETTDDYLILRFNQIVIDGISYSADAVALDPSTANPGMATEIDRRYFTRYVLPAAASFIEGLSGAIAQSESTTVSNEGGTTTSTEEDLDLKQEVASGVEELGREVGEALDEIAQKTKPLIRVAAGTPMGVLFVQPVIEE